MPKKIAVKKSPLPKTLSPKTGITKKVSKLEKISAPKKRVVKRIEELPVRRDLAGRELSLRGPMENISSTEKILVENFVGLQKVMTNLAVKFDELSKQISKLLELFEISAKSVAGKDFDTGRIEKKLDSILDQNKTIARGVSLIHETPEDEEDTKSEKHHRESSRFRPLLRD